MDESILILAREISFNLTQESLIIESGENGNQILLKRSAVLTWR